MAGEIFQRLNQMGERVAVIQSEVDDLKRVPARVNQVEKVVGVLEVHLEAARSDIGTIRAQLSDTTLAVTKLDRDVSEAMHRLDKRVGRLFWTGAGVFLVCSFLVGAANFYNSWLAIQERQHRIEEQASR